MMHLSQICYAVATPTPGPRGAGLRTGLWEALLVGHLRGVRRSPTYVPHSPRVERDSLFWLAGAYPRIKKAVFAVAKDLIEK